MGDFFGNLWQGLIGNGDQGGAGGGIGNFVNQFATGFGGGGGGTTPMSLFGGGVQGLSPNAQAQTLEDIDPFKGLSLGANVTASPYESNNQQWRSNGPQSNWGTPIPQQGTQ
jgi:hypothetical protein